MPFTLTMPKLSPTMEEGTIVRWLKKEGEYVEVGDVLLEVATDKATVEHSALDAGWLRKILVSQGQKALLNQAIAIFSEDKNEELSGYEPEGLKPTVKAAPQPSHKPTSAEPVTQHAHPEAFVQPIIVPEPPLANYKFPFPDSERQERLRISPHARKLAKQQGLDASSVRGSGPGGRVVSRDLAKAQKEALTTTGRRELPAEAPGSYEELPLSPMRQVVAKRLQESKTFVPHFYVTQAIDATALVTIREQLKAQGAKVTINDLIIRAAALSLREYPAVNSGFHSVNQTIVKFKTIDISVAVTVDGGLITPIIRHADYKSLIEISTEIKELATRAKEGKLAREEYMGGSFTISNLGMYGITEFIAVINPPQAAILAISGIEERPVVRNNKVKVAKMMNVTLSADHRVIDGVHAAEFLKVLQKYLESPAVLLI